jgi:ABC-type antimicrobial peptide transport system permease subunit
MESIVSRSVADRSFVLLLVGVFAGVALFVAALGVYSVISYLVTQRKREISIRVALGARAADIVRLVLGQGATLSLIGVAVGAVASLGAARVLAKSLYEISPTDPVAFGSVIVVLVAVALVASWLPARRAARVEAMDVLRGG